MCGIYGMTSNAPSVVRGMIESSCYRGPDGSNVIVKNNVTLGHNLLMITESSELSTQPWTTPNNNILVYNGEIFNYAELVKKYSDFNPKTTCDTELLAWGLDTFGIEFIKEIDSMHAFVYYKDNKLYLSRDHVGIKPLYYTINDKGLIFSSEVRTLIKYVDKEPDPFALQVFSYCGYNYSQNSFFKNIKKVMPGETLEYNIDSKQIKSVYRDIVIGGNNNKMNPEEFREMFSNTIDKLLLGNQPTGIFLSGGFDSTMIAYEVNKRQTPRTFTTKISPNPTHRKGRDFNSDYTTATRMAKEYNYDHTIVDFTPEKLIKYFKKSSYVIDEPSLNISNVMYFYMNKVMGSKGIRVTLAGDVGDELLCGYPKYYRFRNDVKKGKIEIESFRDFLKHTLIRGRDLKKNIGIQDYVSLNDMIDELSNTVFPKDIYDKDDLIGSYMRVDQLSMCTEDFFKRNDRFGMYHFMEGRFPFASKEFMKYCMNINTNEKMYNTDRLPPTKCKLLSSLAYNKLLPDYIINKEKTGWTSPTKLWYEQEHIDYKYNRMFSPFGQFESWKEQHNF